MRYAAARYQSEQRELAYRIYITDSLWLQGQQKRLTSRYIDAITPAVIDNRTGDEIALDVIKRAGLKVKQ